MSKVEKTNITKKERRTPCPRGTRRNKKTGLCEPVTVKAAKTDLNPNTTIPLTEMPPKPAPKPVPKPADTAPVPADTVPKPADTVPPSEMPTATAESATVESATAPLPTSESTSNALKNKQELAERADIISNSTDYDFLYPNLNDPQFNIKISERKEFNDNRYDGEVYTDIEAQADIMCNADYELAPHQLFVRNFLSFQTPYNSLLLYHGLGSGKTCSAISVAEEMRDYIMQMGITSQIIVVASPNVQVNFRMQLFDERKLKLIDGLWDIRACTGNKFLKEINPMNMKGLDRENVLKQINSIIKTYYLFFGYVEFANYIVHHSKLDDETITDPKIIHSIKRSKLRKVFNNRLIIIDEVHNIRVTDDNKDKRVASELMSLIKMVSTLRLLLLSATPMFNSYKEIIWLINIMNINDRRSTIEAKEVFNRDGSFKVSATGEEIGRELLERKATGYISFVRGENPYTFPYRIWTKEFAPEHTFPIKPMPTIQLNGNLPLDQHIDHLSLYLVDIGEYQQRGYNYIINRLKGGHIGNYTQMPNLENIETFGYTMLQQPLEGLNIIYPDPRIDTDLAMASASFNSQEIIGGEGLRRLMNFQENATTSFRSKFDYKPETLATYGRIFSPNEIGKYSSKIKSICDKIVVSQGVILVYSQYIDAGLIPLALALEELGFTRAGNIGSLLSKPPLGKRAGLNYVLITGDKGFSPNPANDIKLLTDDDNKYGEKVKVALISQTGAEGLDLKFIRQVHILEPWYNMNRIEQIIGRAVRTCSHKALPFAQRNVEIYLYGSLMRNGGAEETADLYVYRLAELKAKLIGNVSRVLKEISIDCNLNEGQMNFTEENMAKQKIKPITLELSSGKKLENYKVGDKPFSAICDYMESCSYVCRPAKEIDVNESRMDTYNEYFITMNTDKVVLKIKKLFKERYFYRKSDIISLLNVVKDYPLVQINAALHQLIEDKNEYIVDKYGRLGHLVNFDDLYLFQPLELNQARSSIHDRSVPLNLKHDNLSIKLLPEMKINEAIVNIKENQAPEKSVFDSIKTNIERKYNLAIHPQTLKKGEKDWYMFCNSAIEFMVKNGFDKKDITELVIEHIIDELDFNEMLILLKYLEEPAHINTPLFEHIKRYIDRQVMIGRNNLRGFMWNSNDNKQIIFVKNEAEPWHLAEAEDVKDLDLLIKTRKTNMIEQLNTIVGFLINFKSEKYVVFKIKNITNPRDLGARCDQQSNKSKAIAVLNTIVEKDLFSIHLDIPQREICIIQELYLRSFDRVSKNKKRWFLSPPDANLINIEKYNIHRKI